MAQSLAWVRPRRAARRSGCRARAAAAEAVPAPAREAVDAVRRGSGSPALDHRRRAARAARDRRLLGPRGASASVARESVRRPDSAARAVGGAGTHHGQHRAACGATASCSDSLARLAAGGAASRLLPGVRAGESRRLRPAPPATPCCSSKYNTKSGAILDLQRPLRASSGGDLRHRVPVAVLSEPRRCVHDARRRRLAARAAARATHARAGIRQRR